MSELATGALNSRSIYEYNLTIIEEDDSSRQLSLESLKDPAIFDEVKHRIDQSHFFSLIDLVPTDHILQCRKAELLIYIEEDVEAFALLKDNPLLLARGLEAKLFISLVKHDEFIKLVLPYFFMSLKDSLKQSRADKEGLVHISEMTAIYAYRQDNPELAKYFIELADSYAEILNMQGRLSTIRSFTEEIYRQLKIPFRKTIPASGSYKTQSFQGLKELKNSWLTGKPKLDSFVPDAYQHLVKAWLHLQEGRVYVIEAQLNLINSKEPLVLIHEALLGISFLAKTQKQLSMTIEEFLEQLHHSFALYPYPQLVLQEITQLYPLACLLVSEYLPRFAELSSDIPILANEKYRDGLRWQNKIIVLPVLFRRAWLEDDEYPWHMSHMKRIDKSTRHRALKTLRKHKILKHQIVSVVSYYKACENLSKLGNKKYEILRQKLKKLYPKSLADL